MNLSDSIENYDNASNNSIELLEKKKIFNEITDNDRYGYIRIDPNSEKWKQCIDKQRDEIIKQGVPDSNIILEVCSIDPRKDIFTTLPLFRDLILKIENKNKKSVLFINNILQCSYSIEDFLFLQYIFLEKNIYLVQ